ncbi:PREDICTED: uncharacterized protein LOC107881897 [Prunus mume]|uniref:Uncharacterized protein LOC107881897 n=1 Tax=Prunus mume TaxID=102107 RepID=A0ABM1LYE0_PRUMU|nr:PREDICTED: uncharacterized protein LOC107881897 [Prunus mume]
METVGILVFYNGSWVHKDKIESYEGGEAKGVIVSRNITFSELVDRIYKITNADLNKYCVTLKYSVPLSSSTYKHLKVEDNDDVQYFLKYNMGVMTSKVTPLLATLKIIEGHGIYGCNGIVSIGSSNAPPAIVVRDMNEVIGDSGTENGVTGFNWKDWVEDVNFECVENIVADFCVPRNEEEAYSTPNGHPHRESNFQTSMVQVTQVQSETPQQSSWTQMHTSQVHLVHGKSVEDIDYGLLSDSVNWRLKDSGTIYTLADIKKDVKTNFGVTIGYATAWRSRELGFKTIRGSAEQSYSLLLSGFKSLMRPVIAVDATHLKCKYKGVLFVATAFDGIHRNGLKRAFPKAAHGVCFYHLKGNMKASFKLKKQDPILGFFVQAAKSYRLAEFNRYFSMINNKRVQTYLVRAGLHKWSRAHCDGQRYNVMTTNIAESINSVLRFARMLLVVHLIEEIRNMLQNWFSQRRDLLMKCKSMLCPDLGEKKLRKRLDAASRMNVVKINDVEYNVLDGDMNGLVHLQNHSCTCRKFDLEQLPCKHAIAVCQHLKLNPYSFASSYYTRATWAAAYVESIYPVPLQGTWVIPKNVLPPISKVMSGRRKMQRIPFKGEDSREKKKCSRCSVKGHYRSTCKEAIPITNKKQII